MRISLVIAPRVLAEALKITVVAALPRGCKSFSPRFFLGPDPLNLAALGDGATFIIVALFVLLLAVVIVAVVPLLLLLLLLVVLVVVVIVGLGPCSSGTGGGGVGLLLKGCAGDKDTTGGDVGGCRRTCDTSARYGVH